MKQSKKNTVFWIASQLKCGTDKLSGNACSYQSTPPNIQEEGRFHLHRGGSLKSRSVIFYVYKTCIKRNFGHNENLSVGERFYSSEDPNLMYLCQKEHFWNGKKLSAFFCFITRRVHCVHTHVCICTCICMNVCVCVYIHIYIYTRLYTHIHTYIGTYTYIHTYIGTYTYLRTLCIM